MTIIPESFLLTHREPPVLSSFVSDTTFAPLLARIVATMIVVIGVAMAVGRLGPTIGGALAGLPIVLGPGFYFLILKTPPEFVSEAAAYSLLSLCATQIFLLTYIVCTQRAGPPVSLLTALGAWSAAAALFRLLGPQPLFGTVLFAVLTLVVRRIAKPFVRTGSKPARSSDFIPLLLRGLLAGLLVALVTAAARQLGTAAAGLLLAFPIGYIVVSLTLHDRLGAAATVATLHSAILGTMSLACFCGTLAFAVPIFSPLWALALALAASVSVTVALVLASRRDDRPSGVH